MATKISELQVMLDAKTGKFSQKMQQASRKSKLLSGGIGFLSGKLAALGGLLVGGIAIRGLKNMVSSSMDALDAIGKLSDRTGIAVDELMGLQHAAELTGFSSDKMSKAIDVLQKRLGEAGAGVGQAARWIDIMGLSVDDLLSRDPATQIGMIADKIAAMSSSTQRAAATAALFSRQGQGMVNMLSLGSKGIAEMVQESRDLGNVFSRMDISKIEQANDAMARVKLSVTALKDSIAIQLSNTIAALSKTFTDTWSGSEKGVKRNAAWVMTLNTLLKKTGEAFSFLNKSTKVLAIISLEAMKIKTALDFSLGGKTREEALKQINRQIRAIKVLDKELVNMYMKDDLGASFAKNLERVNKATEEGAKKSSDIQAGDLLGGPVGAMVRNAEQVISRLKGPSSEGADMIDDMTQRAKEIADSVKGPLAKFKEAKDEIMKLISEGFLDDVTGAKALKVLIDQTIQSMQAMDSMPEQKASMFGQGEGKQVNFATGFRPNNPVTTASAQANKQAQSIAKNTQRSTGYLRQIVDNTSGMSFATVAPG